MLSGLPLKTIEGFIRRRKSCPTEGCTLTVLASLFFKESQIAQNIFVTAQRLNIDAVLGADDE